MAECPEAMLIRTPSFFSSHSFFLSPCLCSPPFLPLTIVGAARSLLHSLAFSLTCPPLPCSLHSSSSLAPSFHVSSLLTVLSNPLSLYPFLNPQATDQPNARREKARRREDGRVGVRKKGWLGRRWIEAV